MFFLRRHIKGKKEHGSKGICRALQVGIEYYELRYELRITKNKCSFSL